MFTKLIIPILVAIISLSSVPTFAKGLIKGKIADQTTGSPLGSASVTLHKAKDSAMVAGKITDKNGLFAFNDMPDDNYYLKVNFVGYETRIVAPLSINKSSQLVDLPVIGLSQSSTTTDEVVVSAEKPLMEYQMGKQVINVSKMLTASNGNALDVLKSSPSVEVSAEGQVSLRGSSNVRILIDGKPSPTAGSNLANVLEQIPAGSIENIELITNPSAKYDAEGMSGIINIVTKKKGEFGWNGILNLNAGNGDKYSGSANLNYNTGTVNYFGNYDLFSHNRNSGQEVLRETYSSEGTSLLNQDYGIFNSAIRHFVKLGAEINFNPKNYLMISGGYANTGNKMKGNADYQTELASTITDKRHRYFTVNQPNENFDANLSYKKTFDTKGQEYTIDAYYSDFIMDMSSYSRFEFFNPDGSPSLNVPFVQKNNSDNHIKSLTVQTDYVHPFSPTSKLEAGAKASIRNYNSNTINRNYDYSVFDYVYDSTASNHFVFDEQVLSLYAMYSGMIGDFSYQLGLRGEQTMTKSDLKTTGEKFDKEYFDIFPSAVLSYRFTMTDQVQLSYSRRVDRPQVWLLNPFKDKSDPNAIRSGNPNLKPTYSDSYELGYIKYFGNSMLTPSLFLRRSYDVMTMYTTFNPTEDRIYHTYMNYSDGISYGIDLSFQSRLNSWLSLGTNFSYYKNDVTVNNPDLPKYEKNEYFWNGRFNGNIQILKNLSAQIFAVYMPKTMTPQGMRHESYWADFAIKYDFWESDGAFTFKISNPFDTQKWGGYAKGEGFKFTNTYLPESQVMNIGFTYKINNGLKQQRQRSKIQQENAPPEMF